MIWPFNRKRKDNVKKIEGGLWQYLVSKYHVPLDVIRTFRLVEREVEVGDTPVGLTMFRIFQPGSTKAQDINIENYDSLDSYPELVLYEGYYKNDNGHISDIKIEKTPPVKIIT